MFKKIIEPRHDRRATNFSEMSRYIEDRWLAKGYTDRVGKSFSFYISSWDIRPEPY